MPDHFALCSCYVKLAVHAFSFKFPHNDAGAERWRPSRLFAEWEASCPSEVADFQRPDQNC